MRFRGHGEGSCVRVQGSRVKGQLSVTMSFQCVLHCQKSIVVWVRGSWLFRGQGITEKGQRSRQR